MNGLIEELMISMGRKGFDPLGAGMYSVVYDTKNPNNVLKFFTNRDNGYLQFLKLIARHQNNVHFPKVLGYTKLKGKYESINVIKLEKLQRCRINTLEYDKTGVLQKTVSVWKPIKTITNIYCHMGEDEIKASIRMESFKKQLNSEFLFKTCRLLGLYAKQNNIALDVHYENVMQRNGVVVIIDPYKS